LPHLQQLDQNDAASCGFCSGTLLRLKLSSFEENLTLSRIATLNPGGIRGKLGLIKFPE
jgi:hypothetical protein